MPDKQSHSPASGDETNEDKGERLSIGRRNENEKAEEPPEETEDREIEEDTSRIKDLERQIEILKNEAKDYYDRLLRAHADFENHKKRIQKDKQELIRSIREDIILEFLPVLDNLQRAMNHTKGYNSNDPLVEGLNITLNQFHDTLKKFEVSPIDSVSKPFDPNLHEAYGQVATNDRPPNTIMEELQKGYLIKDRLLRPALVMVAVDKSTESGDNDKKKEEEELKDNNKIIKNYKLCQKPLE